MLKIEIFTSKSIDLERLEKDLAPIGIHSIAATNMKVYSKEAVTTEVYRGVEREIRHPHRLKIEIILPAENRLQLYSFLRDKIELEDGETTKIFTIPMWQTRTLAGEFLQ